MELTEIKELYAEELKLLKRIQNYEKEQRQGELERVDKERAYEELELRTIEYANSLLERREVYRDHVKSTGVEWNDGLIDNFWELAMEDNFLGLLIFNDNQGGLVLTKQTKKQLKEAGFTNHKNVGTTEQKNFLIGIPELEAVASRLFHYYKYFSQYEHFSENGLGDVLVSGDKDGNDNIHLPSAIRALGAGVEEVMKIRSYGTMDWGSRRRSAEHGN